MVVLFLFILSLTAPIVVVSSIPTAHKRDVRSIYVFGDGVSDTGNLYTLTKHTQPDPEFYFHGRFSNGPVWVEYLADELNATLVNFAYGGATTNNKQFPVMVADTGPKVPGCFQQVENFIKMVPPSSVQPERSLVIIQFAGNDLFHSQASAVDYIYNLIQCAQILNSVSGLTDILLVFGNAPGIYPILDKLADPDREAIIAEYQDLAAMFTEEISDLLIIQPEITIHALDYGALLYKVANETLPLVNTRNQSHQASTRPCSNTKNEPFLDTQTKNCNDPGTQIYWDNQYPTTNFHRLMAEQAKLLLDSHDEQTHHCPLNYPDMIGMVSELLDC